MPSMSYTWGAGAAAPFGNVSFVPRSVAELTSNAWPISHCHGTTPVDGVHHGPLFGGTVVGGSVVGGTGRVEVVVGCEVGVTGGVDVVVGCVVVETCVVVVAEPGGSDGSDVEVVGRCLRRNVVVVECRFGRVVVVG